MSRWSEGSLAGRLRYEDVGHAFGLADVVAGVNLVVEENEVVALVGPSGCGKTTLLNMAADLLEPTRGEVHNGFDRTACLFQEPRLLPWKRARENIAWGLKARRVPRAERDGRAARLGGEMGLTAGDLEKFPYELSGGMRQRVALARALVVRPDLLLLDEPFSALDIGIKRDLHDLLLDEIAHRSLTVLFIAHDLMEAVRLTDRILVLAADPGRIVHMHVSSRPPEERDLDYLYATTASLLAEPVVAAAFRGSAESGP